MARDNYDLDIPVRIATADDDAEWQRVNSYIADVLKDCYVLFAKLARLRGDFAGSELSKLDMISAKVRDTGQELAGFSEAFSEGDYSMDKKEQFGEEGVSDFEPPTEPPTEPTAEDFDFSEQGEPEPEDFEVDEDSGKDSEEDSEEKPEEEFEEEK